MSALRAWSEDVASGKFEKLSEFEASLPSLLAATSHERTFNQRPRQAKNRREEEALDDIRLYENVVKFARPFILDVALGKVPDSITARELEEAIWALPAPLTEGMWNWYV